MILPNLLRSLALLPDLQLVATERSRECSACRSADVEEESIVNHFRCAHQALERHFTQGEALICPKCRRLLRHFGVDYDRPGTATVCRACDHVDAEAAIGFLCIDCGAKIDAAVVPTRDWCAYALTDVASAVC